MAWTTSGIFTQTMVDMLGNVTAFDLAAAGDTFNIALYNNSITPDYDASAATIAYNTGQWAIANEVSGTGWAAGGVALTSQALAVATPAAGQFNWDVADVSETGTTLSGIQGALIYNFSLATPVDNQGLCGIYFSGGPYSTTAGTLTITWDTNGVFYIDTVPG